MKRETNAPLPASNNSLLPLPPRTLCAVRTAQQAYPSTRFPNWMGILGRIVRHVYCLAVFFTGTNPVALAMCVGC